MNKGYSLVEFLIGILLSFFVLNLCISNFKLVKINNNYHNQDLISSFQLHQILNIATEVEVFNQEINFKYLNEERTLYLVNNKLIIKPGTVIYYYKIDECQFFINDDKIYLKLVRNKKVSTYLIGKS